MKMLVLGGTVYLSKAVTRAALDRGHEVVVAARGERGDPPEGAEFARVDRAIPDALATSSELAGREFDAVVDVARLPGRVGAALDALADRVGHWTFVSSVNAYADTATSGQRADTSPLVEPTAPDSLQEDLDAYGASKVACENLVRDRMGDRAFVVRPGLIVGPDDPNDRFGYWPLRLSAPRVAERPEVLVPGDPKAGVQLIDVRDLAGWIVDAAESGTAGTYDGISPPMPRDRFFPEIAAAMGTEPDLAWVPDEFLVEQGISPWMGEDALSMWVPAETHAGFLDRDVTGSVEAGMTIRPLAETARDWYAWFQAQPQPPKRAADLSSEKEAEVLAAWHAR